MSEVIYRRAVGAVDAVVDGQVVLLSPADLSYHALDRVGARVWAVLEQPATLSDIVGTLTQEFTVSADQCRTDVQPFLDRMTTIGILETAE